MFDYIIQLPDEINRILQIYTEKKKIKEALALASWFWEILILFFSDKSKFNSDVINMMLLCKKDNGNEYTVA